MIQSFIDRGLDFLLGKVFYSLCSAVQEFFELASDRGPVPRRRRLLRRDGDNADLLVSRDSPT